MSDAPANVLLDAGARPIIAHRGASAHAPENTIPAFEIALEEGAEALEFDVRLSADGVPVLLHDPTLDRTTDVRGAVAALPLERIRAADAGARFTASGERTGSFPWRGQGVRVPTLDEMLAAFPDVPCIVEIKSVSAGRAVRDVLLARGAADRCVVMSFERAALNPFRELPGDAGVGGEARGTMGVARQAWITGATREEAMRLISLRFRSEGFRRSRASGAPEVVAFQALSVPERWHGVPIPMRLLVAQARQRGAPVHVWVVNSVRRAERLWRKGVAGIVTNEPRLIREYRDAGG